MFDVSGKSYNQSRRRLFVILDILENGKNYVSLNDRFAEAFAFLAEKNFEELPDGNYLASFTPEVASPLNIDVGLE